MEDQIHPGRARKPDVSRQPHPVVRVAQRRRQRGAVADGAPRVGVPPGAAAAGAARARRRTDRIRVRRARVVVVVVPVGAPLVADAGEVEEPKRVGRRDAHARRAREAERRRLARPGQVAVLDAAARGLLPLGLRRQPRPRPRPARERLVPRHAHHGLLRIVEAGLAPEGGRRRAGGGEIACVRRVGHGRDGDRERVEPHAVHGPLARRPARVAHEEGAGGDLNEVHEDIMRPMNVAERMGRLGTESAFEVLARAKALERQGKTIVHLEIGEPDFDTPEHIRDAAKRALDAGATHYGPSAGLPELREAIAKHITETRGVPVSSEQVVVTPGAKPIMFFTIMALAGHGDEVIYPNPGFPIYESVINFVGATAVPIPLRESSEFGFDLELLEKSISSRTKLIVINSPANPTGGVLDRAQIDRVAALAAARNIPVLSDEIYRQFLYDGEFVSIYNRPGMAERTIILDGFSKSYAMTGWRPGYGAFPPPPVEPITRLVVNSASCTASFVQLAGVAALQGEQAGRMVAEVKPRRGSLLGGLNKLPGVKCLRPRGAFYVFPNITGTKRSSAEVAERLLNEAGVAALSGAAFGAHGEGYLRFSYANSEANLRAALDRMRPIFESFAR